MRNGRRSGSEKGMLRIEARAPTRIDLAGGTLDIWPLYLFHPGAVTVNCAFARHASCVVEGAPGASGRVRIESLDTHRQEEFASLGALAGAARYRLPLLANLVKFFLERSGESDGLTLATNSEAPAGAGIGGSSAMAVAICAALDRFTGGAEDSALRREDWIHISRDIEAIVIRVPTGTQDHYPAAFGGVSAIHLEPGGERREALTCDVDELERRLVLCYTGKPRQSGINNWEVFVRHINGERRVARILAQIADIARQVRAALLRDDWNELGRLVRAGVGISQTQPADDLDSNHRPNYCGRAQERRTGRQGVRGRRRRLRGADHRAGCACRRGSCYCCSRWHHLAAAY